MAGRSSRSWTRSWFRRWCCDPRPARWPGAALAEPDDIAAKLLELRSSPGAMAGRSLRLGAGQVLAAGVVAILARRDGRAQPDQAGGKPRACCRCDPRPARWPGAAGRGLTYPGAGQAVAILARRDGRAQPTA